MFDRNTHSTTTTLLATLGRLAAAGIITAIVFTAAVYPAAAASLAA
jgi:hypothetical protein